MIALRLKELIPVVLPIIITSPPVVKRKVLIIRVTQLVCSFAQGPLRASIKRKWEQSRMGYVFGDARRVYHLVYVYDKREWWQHCHLIFYYAMQLLNSYQFLIKTLEKSRTYKCFLDAVNLVAKVIQHNIAAR